MRSCKSKRLPWAQGFPTCPQSPVGSQRAGFTGLLDLNRPRPQRVLGNKIWNYCDTGCLKSRGNLVKQGNRHHGGTGLQYYSRGLQVGFVGGFIPLQTLPQQRIARACICANMLAHASLSWTIAWASCTEALQTCKIHFNSQVEKHHICIDPKTRCNTCLNQTNVDIKFGK